MGINSNVTLGEVGGGEGEEKKWKHKNSKKLKNWKFNWGRWKFKNENTKTQKNTKTENSKKPMNGCDVYEGEFDGCEGDENSKMKTLKHKNWKFKKSNERAQCMWGKNKFKNENTKSQKHKNWNFKKSKWKGVMYVREKKIQKTQKLKKLKIQKNPN
jgi:hypothetical protein